MKMLGGIRWTNGEMNYNHHVLKDFNAWGFEIKYTYAAISTNVKEIYFVNFQCQIILPLNIFLIT